MGTAVLVLVQYCTVQYCRQKVQHGAAVCSHPSMRSLLFVTQQDVAVTADVSLAARSGKRVAPAVHTPFHPYNPLLFHTIRVKQRAIEVTLGTSPQP